MFISGKQFHDYINKGNTNYIDEVRSAIEAAKAPKGKKKKKLSLQEAKKFMSLVTKAIVKRDYSLDTEDGDWFDGELTDLGKWIRPWEVVPELKNFKPPKGDFGIGIEVEYGFTSKAAASKIAEMIKNWKYIALDMEGGQYPIEVTFPPILYSKLNASSQCMRYLALLEKNKKLLVQHPTDRYVGIHVNVSMGGRTFTDKHFRFREVTAIIGRLSKARQLKYFGRVANTGGGVRGKNNFLEWKLFNSVTSGARLRQYIDIAIELTKEVAKTTQITEASVVLALETGFNKSLT